MLHKAYDCKVSVTKKMSHEPQEAWHQEELIGGKLPLVN
jgi:hypothetical protein